MGEYKPLGSEKLSGDDKLKRILELTYFNQNNKKSTFKPDLVKESKSGKVYGIVKEKDGYYVKMGLNEQTLDYIGGLFMKNKNKFSSYAEAFKRMELLRGQDNKINEATKYVLKKETTEQDLPPVPDAAAPAPDMSAPAPDMSAPAPDVSAPAPDMSAPAPDATATADSKRSDYMAEVQKFAGKLGQELRDQKEKMESDDIKYVLNMVISAVDLDKLELEDLEEIGKKFDRDEEGSAPEEQEASDETEPSEEPAPASEEPAPAPEEESQFQASESELYEDDPMKDLEEFINSEIDLSSYTKEEPKEEEEKEKEVEIDLDKIKSQVASSIDDILKQYFNR
jgi:hypothetical protein